MKQNYYLVVRCTSLDDQSPQENRCVLRQILPLTRAKGMKSIRLMKTEHWN